MICPHVILLDLDCTLTDRPATMAAFAEAFVQRFGDALRLDPPTGVPVAASASTLEAVVASALASGGAGGDRPRAHVFAHVRRALPWVNVPRPGVLEAFWAETFPALTRPALGLSETLVGLRERGVRLGVVSNGSAAGQQRKIDALGIRPLLSAVVISGAVGVRKPDPRIFALALNAVGANASNTWFVGDHPVADIAGARAAGLTAVWRRGVHPWPDRLDRPRLHIDRLPDLLQLVSGRTVPARKPAGSA